MASPEALRTALVESAREYIGWSWPALPATLFMEFRRYGDRRRYEKQHFARRRALETMIIAECIEDQGRFIDETINGIWHICEESFGVYLRTPYSSEPLPDTARPVIDLFAAETGALMAWGLYLLQPRLDAVSPVIGERVLREVRTRILDPFLQRDDFWWMGLTAPKRQLNNWTPWCVSNCLSAVLICEDDPARRLKSIAKALRILDNFLIPTPKTEDVTRDPHIGAEQAVLCLTASELLYSASDGQICLYDEPLVQDIRRYMYRSFISGRYFVNFADGDAIVNIPADLVYRYGRRINDPLLSALGSGAHHARGEQRFKLRDSCCACFPLSSTSPR